VDVVVGDLVAVCVTVSVSVFVGVMVHVGVEVDVAVTVSVGVSVVVGVAVMASKRNPPTTWCASMSCLCIGCAWGCTSCTWGCNFHPPLKKTENTSPTVPFKSTTCPSVVGANGNGAIHVTKMMTIKVTQRAGPCMRVLCWRRA